MDDHMYDDLLSYAECDLIPRFQAEFLEHKKMSSCPSYPEIKAFCTALNAIAPYAGYGKRKPSDFITTLQ